VVLGPTSGLPAGYVSARVFRLAGEEASEASAQSGGQARLALPHNDNAPAGAPKQGDLAAVARNVGGELCGPETSASCRGRREPAALVPMPETAVDENDGVPAGKDEVGSAGEIAVARARDREPETKAVQQAADDQLGAGAALPNAPHQLAALGRGERVGMGARCPRISSRRGARCGG